MSVIRAVIRNGRVETEQPLDFPDGTPVRIAVPDEPDDEGSPAETARVLALMDRVQPLQMTDAELAAWEADRRAQKEWELAHFKEYEEKIRRMWE